MDAIKTTSLRKVFPGERGTKVTALEDLDLAVPRGKVFGFLGPNGAGKSTTIKILMGLIPPTAGKATILGQDTSKPIAREKVGYLPENPSFYDFLTAAEYLDFVGRVFDLKGPFLRERSQSVLQRLDLMEARNRPIRSYSKGMVQRLGLAQVLIHDPEVLILDEPMSGLDPLGRALVKEIIMDMKAAGKCVFFSTHITSDVEAVCDQVGIIFGGRLQVVSDVRAVLATGITGYNVSFNSNGNQEVHSIAQEDLLSFLEKAAQAGRKISLIEPQRKNIEDFFLEIVHQSKSTL